MPSLSTTDVDDEAVLAVSLYDDSPSERRIRLYLPWFSRCVYPINWGYMMTFVWIVVGLAVGYGMGRLSTPPGPVRYVRVESKDDGETTRGTSARVSAEFNREIFALAERLAAKDLVVSRLSCDYGSFGCWELWVERGADMDNDWKASREVVAVFWDGMEYILTVKSSPREPASAPNAWKEEFEKRIGRDGDSIGVTEEYLVKRLS